MRYYPPDIGERDHRRFNLNLATSGHGIGASGTASHRARGIVAIGQEAAAQALKLGLKRKMGTMVKASLKAGGQAAYKPMSFLLQSRARYQHAVGQGGCFRLNKTTTGRLDQCASGLTASLLPQRDILQTYCRYAC